MSFPILSYNIITESYINNNDFLTHNELAYIINIDLSNFIIYDKINNKIYTNEYILFLYPIVLLILIIILLIDVLIFLIIN
jgi:hypothetical protein